MSREQRNPPAANPGRPNSNAGAWIKAIVRGIAVGTGLSYSIVSRDHEGSSYSSERTSQLEDRRRFRVWQKNLMVGQLCLPVWDAFMDAAARSGQPDFPEARELLTNRRTCSCVEIMPQSWEWIDPTSEQSASDAAIAGNQSTLQDEVGKRDCGARASRGLLRPYRHLPGKRRFHPRSTARATTTHRRSLSGGRTRRDGAPAWPAGAGAGAV